MRRHGYTTLATTKQWVAEFNYTIPRRGKDRDLGLTGKTYRLFVKCRQVDISEEQEHLFTEYRADFERTGPSTLGN